MDGSVSRVVDRDLDELTKGPKHHLADPALAARLVGATREQLLTGGPGEVAIPRDGTFLGALFESLATLSVRVFAQASDARTFHLRTADSRHEVDLIVERDDGGVVAIEAKLAGTVGGDDVRHLAWLRDRVGDRLVDAVVITTGPQATGGRTVSPSSRSESSAREQRDQGRPDGAGPAPTGRGQRSARRRRGAGTRRGPRPGRTRSCRRSGGAGRRRPVA